MFKLISVPIKILGQILTGVGVIISLIGQCIGDINYTEYDEEVAKRDEMCYIDSGHWIYKLKEKIRGC